MKSIITSILFLGFGLGPGMLHAQTITGSIGIASDPTVTITISGEATVALLRAIPGIGPLTTGPAATTLTAAMNTTDTTASLASVNGVSVGMGLIAVTAGSTTLGADLSASDTTITFDPSVSTSGLVAGNTIIIGNEAIVIGTYTSSTTATAAIRGASGSIITSHSNGDLVTFVINTEPMLVTAISSLDATVVRATLGNPAVAHSIGDTVRLIRSGSISQYIKNVVADAVDKIMLTTPGPVVAGGQSTISSAVSVGVQ